MWIWINFIFLIPINIFFCTPRMFKLIIFITLFHFGAANQCYGFFTWNAWSACSKSCAGGFRIRHCINDGTFERERCNAKCFNTGEYYSGACHCPPGTMGDCCDDIKECASNPCKNGGVCKEYSLNQYSCLCPPGTVQPNCDDIHECASNPCKNGGICLENRLNEYTCDCPVGTMGVNCDDILECNSNPCLNGGTCNERINGYTCSCVPGTTGDNCADIPECISNPCQNGGSCIEMINQYRCNCTRQFTGANCQKDLLGTRDSVCSHSTPRSCYVLFQNKETWQDAQDFCLARGGHLAVPDTKDEALFLENYLDSMKLRYPDAIFWIGGKKSGTSLPQWVSGYRISVYRWPFGVSDYVHGTQCLTMNGQYNFEWSAFPCDRSSYFICEESSLFNLDVVG